MCIYLFSVQDSWVKDEEDVIHGDGAQNVQPEPGLDILHWQVGVSKLKHVGIEDKKFLKRDF